jgi:hypothetical protein
VRNARRATPPLMFALGTVPPMLAKSRQLMEL